MSIDIHNDVNTYIYTYIILYTQKYRIWLVQNWERLLQHVIHHPAREWQAQPFLGFLVTSESLGRPRETPRLKFHPIPHDCGILHVSTHLNITYVYIYI